MKAFDTQDQQAQFVAQAIQRLSERGLLLEEIGVFARAKYLLKPVQKQLEALQLHAINLDKQEDAAVSAVRLGTMHRAKGLEFKAVFAVQLSDDKLPFPKAFDDVEDEAAVAEAMERERHLLYVTITRQTLAEHHHQSPDTGRRGLPVGLRYLDASNFDVFAHARNLVDLAPSIP